MKEQFIYIDEKGNKHYFFNKEITKLHREDGPAIEYPSGHKEWWLNGKLHREDGPAFEYPDGHKSWWLNGERHRKDGPAIEYPDGHKEWWLNGKLHREDGPAIEWADGYKSWWLNGEHLSQKEHACRTKKEIVLMPDEVADVEELERERDEAREPLDFFDATNAFIDAALQRYAYRNEKDADLNQVFMRGPFAGWSERQVVELIRQLDENRNLHRLEP